MHFIGSAVAWPLRYSTVGYSYCSRVSGLVVIIPIRHPPPRSLTSHSPSHSLTLHHSSVSSSHSPSSLSLLSLSTPSPFPSPSPSISLWSVLKTLPNPQSTRSNSTTAKFTFASSTSGIRASTPASFCNTRDRLGRYPASIVYHPSSTVLSPSACVYVLQGAQR